MPASGHHPQLPPSSSVVETQGPDLVTSHCRFTPPSLAPGSHTPWRQASGSTVVSLHPLYNLHLPLQPHTGSTIRHMLTATQTGPSRCFPFWQEVLACYVVNTDADNDSGKHKCRPVLEDYYECLHHKKEVRTQPTRPPCSEDRPSTNTTTKTTFLTHCV